MQLRTLWTSNDSDPVGKVIQVPDLFASPATEFPVFQTRFTESKLQQLERWGKEHKALAARQDQYVLHHLCRAFVTEMKALSCIRLQEQDPVCEKLNHAFDVLVGMRCLQFIRITADVLAEPNTFAITAVYQYPTSLRPHTIHVCNLPDDK